MLMQAVFDPMWEENGNRGAYSGVDPATFPKIKSYLQFEKGTWFSDPTAMEAVIGYEAAELEQREVGDLILVPE
jgi:hypothetical protein